MLNPIRIHLLLIISTILVISLACNLTSNLTPPTPNYVMPTSAEAFSWATATISLPADVLAVQITNPTGGAQVPVGKTTEVYFQAGGGPFVEFDLLVDGNLVTQIIDTIPNTPQFSGWMLWPAPTEGSHKVTVVAWTLEKQTVQSEIDVLVGGEIVAQQSTLPISQQATPLPTSGSTSVGGMQIQFLNVTDGGSLPATLDEKQGKPWVTAQVEVTGPACVGVQLQEDGVVVASADNTNQASPFQAELNWYPRRGGGEYVLFVGAGDPNKQAWATSQIRVTVTGVPTFTPSPPPPEQQEASQLITQKYMELWKLDVPYPALRRFDSPDPASTAWISAAYIGGQFYTLHLFDDRHVGSYSAPLNQPVSGGSPTCRPAGTYRILVLFVDYGNTGISRETALNTLQTGTATINAQYVDFAKQHGIATPILQLQVTGAYVSPPPSPGKTITIEQVKALTGNDPAQFDLLAEVDLDAKNTYGGAAGGLAMYGCTGSGTQQVNLWSNVAAAFDMEYLPKTLLIHELDHLMGWAHDWPCGLEGSRAEACNEEPPYLLFGWLDTNGDGVPEILAPNPYGSK